MSCHRVVNVPLAERRLLKEINYEKLQTQITYNLNLISDSGTLNGYYLNFSDSIFCAFRNAQKSEKWLKKLILKQWLSKLVLNINRASMHGLDPHFYHFGYLNQSNLLLKKGLLDSGEIIQYKQIAMLVVLSADATLGLYHDLSCGRVDPGYTGSIDVLPRRPCGNLSRLIEHDSTEKAIQNAFPKFNPYTKLQAEYQRLLLYKGALDSTMLGFKKPIQIGDTLAAKTMNAISKKLMLWGYGNWPDTAFKNQTIYSNELGLAVKRFRIAQNLPASSLLDEATIAKLNISKRTMLLRLKCTLERWRWLGPVNESTKIWANLAENRVYAYKQDTLKLDMNICSGTNRNAEYYRKLKSSKERGSNIVPPDNLETPLFKAKVTHIVVNPVWYVPRNIAVKEILPLIKSNPGVLAKYNYILKDRDGDAINPWAVDWSRITRSNFPYSIEQISGGENSLGKIVIHFYNPFSIYMHDTNVKWVFGLEDRHISHGCMRLEKPFEMAEFISSFAKKDEFDKILLAAELEPKHDKELIKKWKMANINRDSLFFGKYKREENKYFQAAEIIPIYIVYQTAFIGSMGGIKYTTDGYKRDYLMQLEMQKPATKRYKKVIEKNIK